MEEEAEAVLDVNLWDVDVIIVEEVDASNVTLQILSMLIQRLLVIVKCFLLGFGKIFNERTGSNMFYCCLGSK